MDNNNWSGYVQVNTEEYASNRKCKFLWRQILVCSAAWSTYFSLGLLIGTPTIYIAQTQKANATGTILSDEMNSWISSASNYSSIPFLLVMAAYSKYYGRRKAFLFGCITSCAGFLAMFLSTSVIEILLGEFVLGNLIACNYIICSLVFTEFTSPQYRGVFLMLASAVFAFGVLVANSMGLIVHWTYVPLLGCISCVYSFLIGLIWPESPYWLAIHEDYSACSKSHYWLKGHSQDSNEELRSLLKTHQKLVQVKAESPRDRPGVKPFKMLISKPFSRPLGYSVLLICSYHFFGKLACNVYIIQIIQNIVNHQSTAHYGTIIVDFINVLSMFFASVVTRLYRRKLVLLLSSLIGVTFLFLLSIYLYLVKLELMNEDKYLFLFLLSIYMLAISCGPTILVPSITPELCPLRYRGLYMLLVGLAGNIVMGTVIKFTPFLFSIADSHGAFFFFGLISLILTIMVYVIIPETKDKTIFEISKDMHR